MNPSTQPAPAIDSKITLDGLALEAEVVLAVEVVKTKRSAYKSAHATLQEILDAEAHLTTVRQALASHQTIAAEVAAQHQSEADQRERVALRAELEEVRQTLTAQESEALALLEDAELNLHRARANAEQVREAARNLRNTGRQKAARLAFLSGEPSPATSPQHSSKTPLETLRENEKWDQMLAQWRLDEASVPDRMTDFPLTTHANPDQAESAHRHRWLVSMAQIGRWLEMKPALPQAHA
jgi:Fe2+ transport system protein B